MGLRDFLNLNFWWVKLKWQFVFRSMVLVWNGVCKNGNCSLSESQSWLLTWVTDLTSSLWQSWCRSGTQCWLSFCHVATLLTHCKGKICSRLVSSQCCCFWWCWTRWLWGGFCPKMFAFPQSGWISVGCPQNGCCCRSSSWNILTCPEQFWPEVSGRKTKAVLHISQLHLFYVLEHRVQTLCLSIWPYLSNIQLFLTTVKFKPTCQRAHFVSAHAKWQFWCNLVC